jgi:hypothetical protein
MKVLIIIFSIYNLLLYQTHRLTRKDGISCLIRLASAILLLVIIEAIPMRAGAAGDVSSCTDSSLDAALSGGGLVTFSCSGTIQINGTKNITTDTIIDATGQSVTFDGSHRRLADDIAPMIEVDAGTRLEIRNLSIVGMRNISGNSPPILNFGTLIVESSSFRDNKMSGFNTRKTAGAIVNRGRAEIRDSEFLRNVALHSDSADLSGGAIWNDATLIIENSSFIENGGCDDPPPLPTPVPLPELPHSDFCSQTGTIRRGGGAIYSDGAWSDGANIIISDTLFENNAAGQHGQYFSAGAIHSRGTIISIERSEFLNNYGTFGAIYFTSSTNVSELLSVYQTQFVENSSGTGYQGTGAIHLSVNTQARIRESSFIRNNGWGAILNGGQLVVVESVFRHNNTSGAIVNGFKSFSQTSLDWFPGDLEVRRSEFSYNSGGYHDDSNTRGWDGGAITNFYGTASIANSTFFGNVAFVDHSYAAGSCLDYFPPDPVYCHGRGGAIFNGISADLNLTNVTIAWNHSEGLGSGVFNRGTMSVRNTIILDEDPDRPSCVNEGSFDADDSNWSDPGYCDISTVPLEVVHLGEPTGSPAVLPLLAGSFFIERGSNDACALPIVEGIDQRGVPRPYDGDSYGDAICDVGAYESTNRPPELMPTMNIITVNEGELATNSGTVTDPDGDLLSFSANIGEVEDDDGDGIWLWNFHSTDGPDDSTTVLIRATDGNATGSTSFELIVQNVAPDVFAPDSRIEIISGETLLAQAEYVDPSPVDAHVSTIDFGLGEGPEPGTIEVTYPGRGITRGEKRYVEPGIYTVTICVTDDDNGTGCDTLEVEVVPFLVMIDIKPGSFPNSINLDRRGVIPVGILSEADFDATDIIPQTACFGDAEDALQRDCTMEKKKIHPEDANGDGLTDAVLHFATSETGIEFGETEACITAELTDGRFIIGCDSVRTLTR